jgi:RNA polymerase sigma-70 factor (ECF subfamily)
MPDSRRNVIADQEIVALLAQNPRQAMPLIVGKYGETLLGVLLRMTGERELAEDLLQDSMVKVWKNASGYNADRGRLFTWLIGIARNTAIDYLRVQKNQQQRQSVSLDSPVYSERIGSLADDGHPTLVDSGLVETIQKLDEKYRQIIDLLYLQGYTQQQATDILGIPLGTVKTRAQAAIRELRKLLGDADFAVLLVLDQWLRSL